MNRIGIRREDKNEWERRVPLVPSDIADLHRQEGLEFRVQPSPLRVVSDEEFAAVGAQVAEDLSDCPVVVAVKEIPAQVLMPQHAYAFFSHTIKGQHHGMPLLRHILDNECTLIDHERIVDDEGIPLVAFGRYAGLAGMIDALWALGRRWLAQGFETPLLGMGQAVDYDNLDQALAAVAEVGAQIAAHGLPKQVGPLIIGVTGYGKVAHGAGEVLDRLPRVDVAPTDLSSQFIAEASDRVVHVVVFTELDTVSRSDGARFDLADYRAHPEHYRSTFAPALRWLSVLVNSVFWDQRAPRLVTVQDLRDLGPHPRLVLIADLSCDIEGGIEATVMATGTSDPVFVYDPDKTTATLGFDGPGVAILAVDNLPCELPLDASVAFSEALTPFVPHLARADFSRDFTDLDLPAALKRAVVAHQGRLTPDYEYLAEPLRIYGG